MHKLYMLIVDSVMTCGLLLTGHPGDGEEGFPRAEIMIPDRAKLTVGTRQKLASTTISI